VLAVAQPEEELADAVALLVRPIQGIAAGERGVVRSIWNQFTSAMAGSTSSA